jgi:ribosomal protein S18 acetylase RimI-like enzyme
MDGKEINDINVISVSLGPAESFDVEFIKRLSRDVFDIYGPYEETIPSWFKSGRSETIVARAEKTPVGFAMLGLLNSRYDFHSVSELLAIAVEPQWQRKGIGESLLKEADRKAVEMGMKRIFLHTAMDNLRAQRLFTRVGYRPWEIKRAFYPQGQDAYVMAKEPDLKALLTGNI